MYNDDDFNEEEVENSNSPQNQNKILEFYQANKKLIWLLGGVIIFILVFSIILGGGNNTDTPKNEVKLVINKLRETVTIGNTTKLYASVTDASNNILQNAVINWNSSDPSVATVDSNGIIKGIDYGSAIITVTYTDANGKIHTSGCEVVVAKGDPNLKITSVEFPEGELMMSVGAEYQLAPSFKPENGYVTEVKYTSYNKDVVEVDKNTGLVKALKVGKATITLDVNDGEFEDEIDVHVLEESIISQITINPTDIEFLEKFKNVELNQTLELEYDYQPFDANNSNLKWESSNPTVATVENGFVKGLSLGTAEITVTALNGVNDIMTVTVIPEYIAVNSVEILNEKNVTLSVGGTHTIVKDVLPGNASNKNVTFASSNSSVATVDEDGQVRAVSAGSATITVISVDGNKTATVNITVKGSSSSNPGTSNPGTSNPGSSGTSIGTLSYKDKNGVTAKGKNYISTVKTLEYEGPFTISINKTPITKVDICIAKCEDDECKTASCTKESHTSFPFELEIPDEGAGLYVIKATKYNNSYSETISDNYFYIKSGTTDNQGSSTVEVTNVSVPSHISKTVAVGSELIITPTITPSNASKAITCSKDGTYQSTGEADIKVSSSGASCVVTGKSAGNVGIVIRAASKPTIYTKVVIEVKENSGPTYSFDDLITFDSDFHNYFTKDAVGTTMLEDPIDYEFDFKTNRTNLSGNVTSAKFCFTNNNTECSPDSDFDIGESIYLNFTCGIGTHTGRLIIRLNDSNGKTYESTYYVKYKNSLDIDVEHLVNGTWSFPLLGERQLNELRFSANASFVGINYCLDKKECDVEQKTDGFSGYLKETIGDKTYYMKFTNGSTYTATYSPTRAGTLYIGSVASNEKWFCYRLRWSNNINGAAFSDKYCISLSD